MWEQPSTVQLCTCCTSSCTVKLSYPDEKTKCKTHFWVSRDFKAAKEEHFTSLLLILAAPLDEREMSTAASSFKDLVLYTCARKTPLFINIIWALSWLNSTEHLKADRKLYKVGELDKLYQLSAPGPTIFKDQCRTHSNGVMCLFAAIWG